MMCKNKTKHEIKFCSILLIVIKGAGNVTDLILANFENPFIILIREQIDKNLMITFKVKFSAR